MIDDDIQLEEGMIIIPILTNERTEIKAFTMDLIYNSVVNGRLGYMDGKDPTTGEIVPLLVGLDPLPDNTGYAIYPLARLLSNKNNDPLNYLVPDGTGNYHSADGDGAIVQLTGETETGSSEGIDKAKLN